MRTELHLFLTDLIRDNYKETKYGYELSYHKLAQSDKEEFAAHILREEIAKKNEDEWIANNKNLEQIMGRFCSMITSSDPDAQHDFIDVMKQGLVSYYEDSMIEMLQERLSRMEYEDKEREGGYLYQYPDNGEMEWRKRI